MSKSSGFMKDALILFAITLVSGTALGAVYGITKDPIDKAKNAAKYAAYQEVLPAAAEFDEEGMKEKIDASAADLMAQGWGNVYIDSAAAAKDASGNAVGYVISSTSKDGFGGEVKITVGIDGENKITGIAFLSLSETPGLGMNAQNPEFYSQYAGKDAQPLSVVKGGGAGDAEINAMSGATITSSAVTNAVNAATYFAVNCAQ